MIGILDAHSHILPGMDDGSSDIDTSVAMLLEETKQGVDIICATSHFYPQEENPEHFLKRRNASYLELRKAMESKDDKSAFPEILLGAETYYFSGMHNVKDLRELCIGNSRVLLVELPFMACSDRMLDEIDQMHRNLDVIPVIAHVDRYMELFRDWKLPERILKRKMLLQFNASSVERFRLRHMILDLMKEDVPFLLGSDTHNLTDRKPDMDKMISYLKKKTSEDSVKRLVSFGKDLLIN